jgi:nucleoside diphosphate kinase
MCVLCKTHQGGHRAALTAKALLHAGVEVVAAVMAVMTNAAHSAAVVASEALVQVMRAAVMVGAAVQTAAATKAIRQDPITETPRAQPRQVRAVVAAAMVATLLTVTASITIVCQAESIPNAR